MSEGQNQSVFEMLLVLEHMICKNYGLNPKDFYSEVSKSEEAVQIAFFAATDKSEPSKKARKQLKAFFRKIGSFINDFAALGLEDGIDFSENPPILEASDKTTLLSALKAFAEEYDLQTFDDTVTDYPANAGPKKRKDIFNKMAKQGRALQEKFPDVFEDLFCSDPNREYVSEQHFMATIAAMSKASLPYSFREIERLIAMEDASEKNMPVTPDGIRIYMN